MGDMSTFSVTDLSTIFDAEISQKISSTIGKYLENISRNRTSINAISSHLEDFASILKPVFDKVFVEYGLELVNFSFYNLSIDETEERKKYLDRLIASAHTGSYDKSVQQELLKDLSTNPNAAGLATAGAGIGMGMAAGNAFSQMYASAFGNPQSQQQQPQPFGFGGQGRFGARTSQPAQPNVSLDDSNEDKLVEMAKSLSKYKKLFKEGRITEEQYNDMVEFIKNGMN
jgi:membrane protease subunit (stomatin/prohibitin family)